MARKSLLIVPAVVATLIVPATDASARRKASKTDGTVKVTGPTRVDDVRPAGGGNGRRMR